MLNEPLENQFQPKTNEYIWPTQFERPTLQEVIEHYEPLKDQSIQVNLDGLNQELQNTEERSSVFEDAPKIIDKLKLNDYINGFQELLPTLNTLLSNDKFLNFIASTKRDTPSFQEIQEGIKKVNPEIKDHMLKRLTFILRFNCDPLMMKENANYLAQNNHLDSTDKILATSLTDNFELLETYFNYLVKGGERNFIMGNAPGSTNTQEIYHNLQEQWAAAIKLQNPSVPQTDIKEAMEKWFTAPGDYKNPLYENANIYKLGFGNIDGLFILNGNSRKIERNIVHGSCMAEDIKHFATKVEQGMYFGSVMRKVLSLWNQHFPQIKIDQFPDKWDMKFNYDIVDYARRWGIPINPFELDNGMWTQKTRTLDLMIGTPLEKPGNEMFFEEITDGNAITAKRIINDVRKSSHELTHMMLSDLLLKDINQSPLPSDEQLLGITNEDVEYGPYSSIQEGVSILMEELTLSALVSEPNQIGCNFDDSKYISDQIVVRRNHLEQALKDYKLSKDQNLLPEMPYAEGFVKIIWPLFVHGSIGLDQDYSYTKGMDAVMSFISSIDTAKLFLLPRSDETYQRLLSIEDVNSDDWEVEVWEETFNAFRNKIAKDPVI